MDARLKRKRSQFEYGKVAYCQSHYFRSEVIYIPSLARDQNEIRLLVLLPANTHDTMGTPHQDPGPGSSGTEAQNSLHCRLMTVKLDLAPPYVAVSYTWATEDGDSSLTRCIYVHTEDEVNSVQTIDITVNCETALKQIRDSPISEAIWIDAICIDQNRISERNHQVSMMDRNYKNATAVEVCIQCAAHTLQAVVCLEEAAKSFASVTSTSGVHLESRVISAFEQLRVFFDHRYFSRVWVRIHEKCYRMTLTVAE
jgi:hypothetical protein